MKTLYLHIGTPKTATTSIQYFCRENKEALQEIGYCYPIFEYKYRHVDIVRNAHFLFAWQYDENKKRNIMEEERIFREGMDQIETLFRKYDNIILSDEGVWRGSQSRKPDLWKVLKKESEKIGFKIKVIVYLRRQDGFANSWWNQQIKAGLRAYSKMSWEEFIHRDPPAMHLDYYKGIKRIEEYIGKENIIVRRFGRKYFKNGSIHEDFLDAVGLRWNDKFVISEETKNIGLFGNPHEIKRQLNSIPELNDKQNRFFRKVLLEMSESSGIKKESMFSEEEAKEFMKPYEEGNRKVAEEYLGDEELFELDFSNMEKRVINYDKLLDDTIVFTGKVAIALREENDELKKRIDAQDKLLKEQQKMIGELNNRLNHPFRNAVSALKNRK